MQNESFNSNNLLKNMVKLLIPLIITNSLSVLTYLINSVWIGRLIGENGVASIANCYPMTVVVSSVIIAFASAISVLVSQYYGAKQKEKIKGLIGCSYIFSSILGIIIAIIIIIFTDKYLQLLSTPEIVFNDSKAYLTLYSIAFIFNFVLLIVSESIRALGNNKIPLIFVAIETIINIVAVPILIIAGLGITGVALANVLAKLIVMIIAIIYVNKKCEMLKVNKNYLKVDTYFLKKILTVGIPVLIEQYVIAIVITVETSISNKSGVIGSASYGVVARWEQIFLVLSQSIQTVITILIGQYIGKGKMDKIHFIIINGLKLSAIPTMFICLVVFAFPSKFCSIFVNSNEVIEMAVRYLSVVGFAYILMPIRLMFNGFVIGTAHTNFLFFSSITSSILEVIVMFSLLNGNNMNSMICLGFSVLTYVLTDTILNFGFYFSGIWKKKIISN